MGENTNTIETPKIVVDASAVLARLLPDESQSGVVREYFTQFVSSKINFYAPELLKYEVANALRSAVLRERMTQEVALELLKEFLSLSILYEDVVFDEVLELAIKSKISVYDASYVWLAGQMGVELLTLDERLPSLVRLS